MSRRLVDGVMVKPAVPHAGKQVGTGTTLTEELIKDICRPLLIGLPVSSSCALLSIGYDTLRYWVVQGYEHPDSIYGKFINEVKKAIAQWETRDLSVIEMHAQGKPATYEMEVVREPDGTVARDEKGSPARICSRTILA